jgi:cyanophycinase-like exopeptidase
MTPGARAGRLVIIGSGETAPTMVKLHRSVIEQAPAGPRSMLDTPFGFQANADDLTAKVQEYFADAVGFPIEVARWRRRDEAASLRERSLALVDRSTYAFAGPGSPTYALGQWQGSEVPAALGGVIERGGTVVLGSAAAVTAGAWSVPVYEIYKVGEEPHWVPGLDLLCGVLGVTAAVIPHFDNREGGRHDTRYCYLGEQRLAVMEALLPEGVGVIGVDEHTAIVFDRAEAKVDVHGAGGLTVRAAGREHVIPSGSAVTFDAQHRHLSGDAASSAAAVASAPAAPAVAEAAAESSSVTSLREVAAEEKARFDERLAIGDADGALEAALRLEEAIHAWAADTLQGADLSTSRRLLRSMMVALAGAAQDGLRDPHEVLDPVVQVVLDARARARSGGDYATSDALRDGLLAAGVEVRDTPEGPVWAFTGSDDG